MEAPQGAGGAETVEGKRHRGCAVIFEGHPCWVLADGEGEGARGAEGAGSEGKEGGSGPP